MRILSGACFVISVAAASTALAQVDIRSPWANVYVGPGGVYVHGPWGRVDVPSVDRERVCDQWRESIGNHYKGQDCKVTFNDDNCTIKDVDCADEGSGKGTDDKDTDTGEGPKEL